jgi:hypothetical protein
MRLDAAAAAFSAILTHRGVQKMHGRRATASGHPTKYGLSLYVPPFAAKKSRIAAARRKVSCERILRCKTIFMIAHTMRSRIKRKPVIFGTISWIANELVGIRTLEHTLSEKLESGKQADKRLLLDQIRDLNVRVKVLDLALDNYVCAGRQRWS